MTTMFDDLPAEFRDVVVELLGQRDPELLGALLKQSKPTLEQQEAVIDILGDAFTEHLGAGHEPTVRGALIDNALGAFLTRWPAEELADS
ncbi:hypothetical protein [Amycolatopsis vastitatis]|uniref:Uncharacterized protein n=1 Tax=Amycolatopsis vastitatis TaxID=1905142 RepID=A0A229T2A8_9PSEU|nr:hypothetical protein [Amycolatopsis vastitatis]OXM65377.1 hypothetical protein CF165_23950 [Amycolatopsis vastitatis]